MIPLTPNDALSQKISSQIPIKPQTTLQNPLIANLANDLINSLQTHEPDNFTNRNIKLIRPMK
jgi:hypothetical protein